MTVGWEPGVEAKRPRKGRVRVRREFSSSGQALEGLAAQVASRVPGLGPERAAEILERMGRRRAA